MWLVHTQWSAGLLPSAHHGVLDACSRDRLCPPVNARIGVRPAAPAQRHRARVKGRESSRGLFAFGVCIFGFGPKSRQKGEE